MQEFLAANGDEVVVFASVLLALVVLVSPVIYLIAQWRRVRLAQVQAALARAEMDAALKQDMLNRGLSAADIRQILESSSAPPGAAGEGPGAFGEQLRHSWDEFGRKWAKAGRWWGGCGSRHRG